MKEELDLKYAILFGGGAIRGMAYCGAVQALEELNVSWDIIAGSSVGSIFAGLLAVGYNATEIREIIQKVNFELFKDIQFALGPQFALSKGEVFLDWIRDLIEKKFYGEKYKKGSHKAVTFADLDKSLVIITTDLSNFECKEFSKFETPDFEIATAIRISSSMPGLMKPIEYNNRLLVDGDLQKSVPMWKLSKNLQPETDRILEFRLEGNFEGHDRNTIEYLNSIYSYATCSGTKFLTELYGCRDQYDYVVLDTGDLNIVDFNISDERRDELVKGGYEQTITYFTQQLYCKKDQFCKIYRKIYKYLEDCEKHITSGRIAAAKQSIGDLYMYICDFTDLINENDLKYINEFKNTFINNIKYPALFGKTKLNNENLIFAVLKQSMDKTKGRINEYNKFLAGIKAYIKPECSVN